MMRHFFTTLLLIALLFPPGSLASITMACSMPEMMDMVMSQGHEQMSNVPSDAAHACCPAPAPEKPCEATTLGDAYQCCDEERTSREQSLHRVMPIPRRDASDLSLLFSAVSKDLPIDATSVPRLTPPRTITFLDSTSPPLQVVLCTHII